MIMNTLLGQKLNKNSDWDSNVKICLHPGLEAQKVEKHWTRVCSCDKSPREKKRD